MSENETEAPVPPVTPRLVFDETSLAEVPAFLRDEVATPIHPVDEPSIAAVSAEVYEPAIGAAVDEPEPHETVDSAGQNFDDMSVEQLRQHQEELNRKIEEKQLAEKQAVIDQIAVVVKTYKITTEELVEALGGLKIRRKGVKAKPKYRDPKTGTVWSGRGKEPAWIKGKDRSKFLIKN